MAMLDIKGKRFGMILVLEYVKTDDYGNRHWKCICDCGRVFVRRASNLAHSKYISCGCIRNAKSSQRMGERHNNRTLRK